jgi:hypothetical protein
MGTFKAAFFISPEGEIIEVDQSHIQKVIENPMKFGIDPETIQSKYREFGEPLGLEGNARETILLDLIDRGWIRLRRYPGYWVINVHDLTHDIQEYLYRWANLVADGGEKFMEMDPYMEIQIRSMEPPYLYRTSVQDLRDGKTIIQ